MPIVWAVMALLGIGAVAKTSGDIEGVSENIAKAAPWVAAAAGAYLLSKAITRGR